MAAQSTASVSAGGTLTKQSFTGNPQVQACLSDLKNNFSDPAASGIAGKKPFIISDVLDDAGHQYVDLVQKGGGVLGIALVGYTYVLEQMGIRFRSLAGTSAGAINTGMMTVIPQQEGQTKSESIIEELCALNFFNLVDGNVAAKWVIKRFVTQPDFSARVKRWALVIIAIFVLLLAGDFLLFGVQHSVSWAFCASKVLFALTAMYIAFLLVLGVYIASLLKKLKNSGYGVNPGDFLYDWIKGMFHKNGVDTVSQLEKKAATLPALQLRQGINNPAGVSGLDGTVTFITSELVTENKLELPRMCDLFRKPEDIDTLQPAGFVRASMSIPVFFESYYIKDIPCDDPGIKQRWRDTFDENDPPGTVRFVDGGILSNFPINLFYNADIKIPRLPTFGIDLDDSKPDDNTKNAGSWSFAGYLGRMFNTIRFYYDKDFLLKNKIMQLGVGKVPLSKYNWLNFFLSDEEKMGMFVAGAVAAKDFLINFDWDEYKGKRADLHLQLHGNAPSA